MKVTTLLATVLTASVATSALAEGFVNLYSSRHYDTDERLYSDFEDATGITINRIEGNADELVARIRAEGSSSPADILITVDTSRLARAKAADILQPIDSPILEAKIPANLQDADNQWFGFSQRARIIFYSKDEVANPPKTYLDLAKPEYKGMVCIRSSTNTYNQTLMAAILTNHGPDVAKSWAEGIVANMARNPQGGDTDQLRGLISGECKIAVSNSYYFARALRTDVKGVSDQIDKIAWVFPAQDAEGAHMNLSGAGVAKYSPNRDNAIKFLEYLASDQAQMYFSNGNDEFPAVAGVELAENVKKLGPFKADSVNLSEVATNIPEAQRIFNQAGWK